MNTTQKTSYLPTLDGWRAIAILLVMICHGFEKYLHPEGEFANTFFYNLTRLGSKGVDIFFGISGFLICSRLLLERQWDGVINLKSFYLRRFFRIIPPYYFYLITIAILAAVQILDCDINESLFSFTFIRNFLPNNWPQGDYTGHLWSIAIEEHFYLLFPMLLILSGPKKDKWVLASLGFIIAIWRFIDFKYHPLRSQIPEIGFASRTDVRLDSLLWGAYFAILVSDPAWQTRIKDLLGKAWYFFVAALSFVIFKNPPLALTLQSVLVPLVILGTIYFPGRYTSIILESPILKWIGRISYSLYLWNSLFFIAYDSKSMHKISWLQDFPFNLIMVFTMASISYYFIEKPFIRLGYRFAKPNENLNVNRERNI